MSEHGNGSGDPVDGITVLVVDDQQLIREGIASLLSIQPGITVVGMAGDGGEAVEKAVALNPDVVLMDVRMPGCDGVRATGQIRRELPECQVIMLTTFDDEEYVVQALRAGAVGYLLKDVPAQELADAVRLARSGIVPFDSVAAGRLSSALARHQAAATPSITTMAAGDGDDATTPGKIGQSLTAREIDVLRLIARGATNREIAADLFLSEGTVKNHISRILNRVGLRDRTQAAIYARDHGLL